MTTKQCAAFAVTGTCLLGARCRFQHGDDAVTKSQQDQQQQAAGGGASSTSSSTDALLPSPAELARVDCRLHGLKFPCGGCGLRHSEGTALVNRTVHCEILRTTGSCPRGDECPFQHDFTVEPLCRQHFSYGTCRDARVCGLCHQLSQDKHAAAKCVVVMRHGERADDAEAEPALDPDWQPGNTSLTRRGFQEAISTAAPRFLQMAGDLARRHFQNQNQNAEQRPLRVSIYASPFLRCLQTARGMIEGLQLLGASAVSLERVVVDAELCEVYGPSVIKDMPAGSPGPGVTDEPWRELGIPRERCAVAGQLPRWGEDRRAAYDRLGRRMQALLDERHTDSDIVLVSTHGDAVNATVKALHPTREVYACEYLGMAALTPRAGSGPGQWQAEVGAGVEWMDDMM